MTGVVVPYLIGGAWALCFAAIGLAVLALCTVGAGLSALDGRSAPRSGLRRVIVGSLAAGRELRGRAPRRRGHVLTRRERLGRASS